MKKSICNYQIIGLFVCSQIHVGTDKHGKPVFLRDIWPSRAELQEVERQHVLPVMFKEVYSKITEGNEKCNSLVASDSLLYSWDETSTYIKNPPFLEKMVHFDIKMMICFSITL